jgi:hypothetical protein
MHVKVKSEWIFALLDVQMCQDYLYLIYEQSPYGNLLKSGI